MHLATTLTILPGGHLTRETLTWDRIYGIKQPKEPDASHGPGECITKSLHKPIKLSLLAALGFRLTKAGLPLLKSFPSEAEHLLVTCTEQAHAVEHLCQKASRICATAEPEKIEIVSVGIKPHEKLVGTHHMCIEGRPYGLVFCPCIS